MDGMITRLAIIVRDVFVRFTSNDGIPLAGNIAFCTLLAVFPFLIFLTALAGFLGDEHLAQTVVDYLLAVAPKEIVDPVEDEIHALLTVPQGGLLTISILFTLYTAAGGVESVRVGLNRAYGYTETRLWPFRFVQNVGFVIGGAIVLIALALLIVFGPLYWGRLEAWAPVLEEFSGIFHLLRLPVGLGLMFVGLVLAHKFLPVKRHPLIEILPGIVITMVLWFLCATVYAVYLAKFARFQLMYAGLANVIIALIFLYITALIMILGGEINQSLIRLRREGRNI